MFTRSSTVAITRDARSTLLNRFRAWHVLSDSHLAALAGGGGCADDFGGVLDVADLGGSCPCVSSRSAPFIPRSCVHLSLADSGGRWESKAIAELLRRLPRLASLDLGRCKLGSSALAAASSLPVLSALSLRDCDVSSRGCESAIARPMLAVQNLVSLDLSGCGRAVSDSPFVESLVSNGPKLRLASLSISRTAVTEDGVAKIIRQCESVTQLKLSCPKSSRAVADALRERGSRLNVLEFDVAADSLVAATAAGCPGLVSLVVEDASEIEGSCLSTLHSSCLALERLLLKKGRDMTDVHVLAWAESAAASRTCRLEELALSGSLRVGNAALAQLIAAVGGALRLLDFAGAFRLGDAVLVAVGKSCPHLRSLDLTLCGSITDAGVMAVARGCRELEQVTMYNVTNAGDAGIIELATACDGQRFSSIQIYGLRNLTSAGIVSIAVNMPNLTSLDMSSCLGIDDSALVAVGRGCPRLSRILLLGCQSVTDAGLIAVARGCPLLRQLMLNGCKLLTDAALIALSRHCVSLESVSAVSCDLLSSAGLVALIEATFRTLTKVRISIGCAVEGSTVRRLSQQFPTVAILVV